MFSCVWDAYLKASCEWEHLCTSLKTFETHLQWDVVFHEIVFHDRPVPVFLPKYALVRPVLPVHSYRLWTPIGPEKKMKALTTGTKSKAKPAIGASSSGTAGASSSSALALGGASSLSSCVGACGSIGVASDPIAPVPIADGGDDFARDEAIASDAEEDRDSDASGIATGADGPLSTVHALLDSNMKRCQSFGGTGNICTHLGAGVQT